MQRVWHMARSAKPKMAQHMQEHSICFGRLNIPKDWATCRS